MKYYIYRMYLLWSTACSLAIISTSASAQSKEAGEDGLQEIIVTAQKREQSSQDVPIALTAITTETLAANRITTVADLSGLAPGLTVAATAGAGKTPSFTLRGTNGTGVVPGSDRQVPIYLDGIYLAGSRGQIFDLPDIERIEVLRGPQGTLFGRNATAGAISISTRDPSGEMGVKATVTAGNYNQYRFMASVDLPQIGPFSAYVSFLHSQRDGDIRNTAAGQIWDRTASAVPSIAKVTRSPNFLGSENLESLFAAVKFESGDFTTVYKYDRLWSEGTSSAAGVVGINPAGPVGALLTALVQSQAFPVPIASDGKRPDALANGFASLVPQHAEGHSVISTYRINDHLSVKNLFGYRTSDIFGASSLDGLSSLIITPQSLPALSALFGQPAANLVGLVGAPFLGIVNQSQGRTKQISDELQLNFTSEFLTATVGALWFNAKDWGNEFQLPATLAFTPLPGGVLRKGTIGMSFNETKSIAAYAQLEFHLTSQLDFIAGGRVSNDKKTGNLVSGPTPASLTVLTNPIDQKTRFNYLLGLNYKPTDDILLYGKYSTGYLGGGNVVGIPYDAETVKSGELGIKSEWLDHKLRANLALFYAKYHNVQQAQGATSPGYPAYITAVTGDPTRYLVTNTFILPSGNLTARGFEFDFTAAPMHGFTLGGSLSYTHSTLRDVPALVLAAQYGGELQLFARPEWTGNLWAEYDTPPIGAGEAYFAIRGDARYQSSQLLAQSPSNPAYLTFAKAARDIPGYFVFNARVSLKKLDLGGVNTEVAAWGKNLSNNRSANYGFNLGVLAALNYIPARTYGFDVAVAF